MEIKIGPTLGSVVKLIKTESRAVVTLGVGGGEMGSCLIGVEFQFCKMVIIVMQQCECI